MGRRWMPLVVVFVGALLGVAVAGLPDRRKDDAPLAVRTTAPSTAVPTTVVTTSTTPPPPSTRGRSELSVATINASNVTGAAARLAARLEETGYDVGSPTSGRAQETSAVLHRPDLAAEAGALAVSLGLDLALLQPTDSPPVDADLVVIIGEDFASRS